LFVNIIKYCSTYIKLLCSRDFSILPFMG